MRRLCCTWHKTYVYANFRSIYFYFSRYQEKSIKLFTPKSNNFSIWKQISSTPTSNSWNIKRRLILCCCNYRSWIIIVLVTRMQHKSLKKACFSALHIKTKIRGRKRLFKSKIQIIKMYGVSSLLVRPTILRYVCHV